MAVMASRRAMARRRRQASSPAAVATATATATVRARRPGIGRCRASDPLVDSERWPWRGEQASTGNGNGKQLDWSQNEQSEAAASQQRRLKYPGRTVGLCHTNEKFSRRFSCPMGARGCGRARGPEGGPAVRSQSAASVQSAGQHAWARGQPQRGQPQRSHSAAQGGARLRKAAPLRRPARSGQPQRRPGAGRPVRVAGSGSGPRVQGLACSATVSSDPSVIRVSQSESRVLPALSISRNTNGPGLWPQCGVPAATRRAIARSPRQSESVRVSPSQSSRSECLRSRRLSVHRAGQPVRIDAGKAIRGNLERTPRGAEARGRLRRN